MSETILPADLATPHWFSFNQPEFEYRVSTIRCNVPHQTETLRTLWFGNSDSTALEHKTVKHCFLHQLLREYGAARTLSSLSTTHSASQLAVGVARHRQGNFAPWFTWLGSTDAVNVNSSCLFALAFSLLFALSSRRREYKTFLRQYRETFPQLETSSFPKKMFFWIAIILAHLVAWLFYELYWKRRNFPPGPTPYPLLGNMFQTFTSNEHMKVVVKN